MKRLVVLVVICLALQNIKAETLVSVEIQKNSTISIKGSTNLINFQLVQSSENLPNRNFSISGNQVQNKFMLGEHTIPLAVKGFTSDNIMAIRDFLKLIKAKEYPIILIHIISFETGAQKEKELSGKTIATVNLNITGISKQYLIPIDTKQIGDQLILKGSKHISIRDFSLIPPVEMLGLLKVSEWIDIQFDIHCKINALKMVAIK